MHIFTGVLPCTLTNKSSGHTPEYSLGMRLNISLMSQGRYLDWRRRALWIQTAVHVLRWRHTQMQRGFIIVLFQRWTNTVKCWQQWICVYFSYDISVYIRCVFEKDCILYLSYSCLCLYTVFLQYSPAKIHKNTVIAEYSSAKIHTK